MHLGRVYGQLINYKNMEVGFADSFFDSFKRMVNREKWYWKTWDFLRYDMPRFFRNLWMFRKDLYNYRWYSGQHAVLPFMKTALIDMASKIDERGLEVEKSKDKKVAKMYRAAFIMERFIEDDFIEIAEQELGELVHHKFEFEDVPDKPGYSRLVDNETPEEKEHNSKVFKRAREIESQMWKELWTILEGQNHSHFEVFLDKSKDKKNAWDNWFDGSGLRGWWD
jgi:hypothetical protein